jgi:ABC-type Fe3+ transport system permease subunit
MLVATLSIYGGPLFIIFIIYTYILQYARRTIRVGRKQRKANKRDVIILKRIVILLLFLIMIGVPTLSILVTYMITGYLTPLVYDIQAVNISIGLVTTPVVLVFITPKIRNIFRRNEKPIRCISIRKPIQSSTTDSSPTQ